MTSKCSVPFGENAVCQYVGRTIAVTPSTDRRFQPYWEGMTNDDSSALENRKGIDDHIDIQESTGRAQGSPGTRVIQDSRGGCVFPHTGRINALTSSTHGRFPSYWERRTKLAIAPPCTNTIIILKYKRTRGEPIGSPGEHQVGTRRIQDHV